MKPFDIPPNDDIVVSLYFRYYREKYEKLIKSSNLSQWEHQVTPYELLIQRAINSFSIY